MFIKHPVQWGPSARLSKTFSLETRFDLVFLQPPKESTMIVDKYHVKNLTVVTTQALDRNAVKLII